MSKKSTDNNFNFSDSSHQRTLDFMIKSDAFFLSLSEIDRESLIYSILRFAIYFHLNLKFIGFFFTEKFKSELCKTFDLWQKCHQLKDLHQVSQKLTIDFITCDSKDNLDFTLSTIDFLASDSSILLALKNKDVSELIPYEDSEQRLAARLAVAKLHLAPKYRIAIDEPFFGPGPSDVLAKLDELGKVSLVASSSGISYSKLWKILDKIESNLGKKIVSRKQGGIGGGKVELNPEAQYLLNFYELIEIELNKYAENLIQNNFPYEIFFDKQTKPN